MLRKGFDKEKTGSPEYKISGSLVYGQIRVARIKVMSDGYRRSRKYIMQLKEGAY